MRVSEAVLAPDLLDRLAEKIEAEMGLSFGEAKRRDLLGGVHRIAEAADLDSDACVEWLLDGRWDKAKADLCARHLTIGETYFFREPRAFELVCGYARRKMDNGGRLRIWSAGCCTGEEAYSIAMTLRQRVPELDPERISILATDINDSNLERARAGVYRQWSFRNTGDAMRKLNFSEEDGSQFRINDEIRKLVGFAELNLALPVFPSIATGTQALDIIFCRNVLMYFSRPQARQVIERFRQCLVPGGWLIVSPGEASAELFAGFAPTYYPDAIYFQKNDLQPGGSTPAAMPLSGAATMPGPAAGMPARARPAAEASTRSPARTRPAEQPKSARPHPAAGGAVSPDAHADAVSRARALANEGRMAEAMHDLEQALASGPPTAELYHAKALIAMEAGDQRAAMQSLKRVLYLKPDFILAHYLSGVLQSMRERRGDAVRQFERAAELLEALDGDAVVPGSDGLPAAYLLESVRAYLRRSDK